MKYLSSFLSDCWDEYLTKARKGEGGLCALQFQVSPALRSLVS